MFEWLEATSLSVWVREAQTIWAFPMILTLHTFGLALLVGGSVVIDLRLLGIGRQMPVAPLRMLFRVVWAGFWLSLITGSTLFAAYATMRGTSPVFYAKLLFVALGVSTVVLIRRAVFDVPAEIAATGSVKLMALLSLAAWTAAITTGRLLAYL